jgi:hypothetical protein
MAGIAGGEAHRGAARPWPQLSAGMDNLWLAQAIASTAFRQGSALKMLASTSQPSDAMHGNRRLTTEGTSAPSGSCRCRRPQGRTAPGVTDCGVATECRNFTTDRHIIRRWALG